MTKGWVPFTAEYPTGADLPTDRVVYGPEIADEPALRLLGDPAGKRVLELGVGAGRAAVAIARRGARVIAVDPSVEQLEHTRDAADDATVKMELHHAALHELAFLSADSIDVALSIYRLAMVHDLDRVLRQAHRVLKPEARFVVSLPHPAFGSIDPSAKDPLRISRSWFDRHPQNLATDGQDTVVYRRTLSDVFTAFVRAGFRIDTLLEPEPVDAADDERSLHWSPAMSWIPATLLIRATKEGI